MQQRVCDRCGANINEQRHFRIYHASFDDNRQIKKTGKDLCAACNFLFFDFLNGKEVPAGKGGGKTYDHS